MPPTRFARVIAAHGIRLDLKSRMLLSGRMVFINGESVSVEAAPRITLQQLADRRNLPPGTRFKAVTRELLYQWYRAGYIEAGDSVIE